MSDNEEDDTMIKLGPYIGKVREENIPYNEVDTTSVSDSSDPSSLDC